MTPRRTVLPLLAIQVIAVVATASVLLLVAGIPLAARGLLTTTSFPILVAIAALASTIAGVVLLWRAVGIPIDRLLDAAERLRDAPGSASELPPLGDAGEAGLSRAALAFERTARALVEERDRLAAKIDELTVANRALAEARESLHRSERMATVGRLAAGLAHEVGNPLGTITGYVELGRTRLPKDADPELAGALARIAAAAERIDHTVRELLDFARPGRPELRAVAIGPVVDTVLRLLRGHARFREIEVEVTMAAGLPEVRADPRQLEQVLVNVLLNAADAMGGRGRVEVAARAEGEGAPERVALTIADHGPGIPPELLERIFDPFFTTKEPGAGSGLGLAVSNRIVESFGGELAVRSRPGAGASFTLSLRVAAEGAPA